MQTQIAPFPENMFFLFVDLNKLSSVSLPEILFPSAHLRAVTQGTLTRYKTSRTRTERRRGQSADTCPGWPRPLPPQSSNQLSGLPAIGQWRYTEGQSQLTQTLNPVGALTSPCQSGVELMRVVLCFRHHMDASHGATAVTGQPYYESDQSQPKYINQTWNQVHISIRNRKTFTQHEWCIHKTESQSDPNGLNTFNTIEHFRMLSSMCVAFYFSKNDVGNQQFTAETVWPFKPRIQSANVEHRKSSLLCNQPYFVSVFAQLTNYALRMFCWRSQLVMKMLWRSSFHQTVLTLWCSSVYIYNIL